MCAHHHHHHPSVCTPSPPLIVHHHQAERRLQEEVERVRAYLDESTEPKITKVAEQELIKEQVSDEGG